MKPILTDEQRALVVDALTQKIDEIDLEFPKASKPFKNARTKIIDGHEGTLTKNVRDYIEMCIQLFYLKPLMKDFEPDIPPSNITPDYFVSLQKLKELYTIRNVVGKKERFIIPKELSKIFKLSQGDKFNLSRGGDKVYTLSTNVKGVGELTWEEHPSKTISTFLFKTGKRFGTNNLSKDETVVILKESDEKWPNESIRFIVSVLEKQHFYFHKDEYSNILS